MKVFKDLLTGEEFFSDAKDIEAVKWVDPDTKEEVETGLVRTKAKVQTAGGGSIDVGGGNAFGGAADDESAQDAEESKLDQFWTFPGIENEVKFSSFAEFKKAYFMPFLVTYQKLAVEKGAAKDAAEMKEKGKRMAGAAMKWIKAHFDELQFYSLEMYMVDGGDVSDKHKDVTFAVNLAYVRYEGADPYFYFIRDAFTETKF